MLRAVRPCLATTSGRLIILTSPYGQSGATYDLYKRHFGRDDAPTLVWQASAQDMNPTLPKDYLDRMQQDDPEAYRSEVLGEFRAGVSSFLDPSVIEACVESGVRERAPEAGRRYTSFIDSASGSGIDQFTVAISHAEGQRAVLDVVRAWAPPFNPSSVIAETAALLKSYGLRFTQGDRYSPGFVREGFGSHDIEYRFCEQDRSTLYLEALPLFNSGQAVLLDLPELLRELRGLERRRGTSGRDRIDHVPGSHDDLANAASGALVFSAQRLRQPPLLLRSGGVTIGGLPPTPPASMPTPGLVARVTGAIKAGAQTLTDAVTHGVDHAKGVAVAVQQTVSQTEPQAYPTHDGHKRTITEIHNLSEGARSKQEQARLDQYDEQQRRKQARAFEEQIKGCPFGVYFPSDQFGSGWNQTTAGIRDYFARWH